MATTSSTAATDSAPATRRSETTGASGEAPRTLRKKRRVGTAENSEETSAFQTMLEEMTALREDIRRRDDEIRARMDRQDERLCQLSSSQLSQFQFANNAGGGSNFVTAGTSSFTEVNRAPNLGFNFGSSGSSAFPRVPSTYKLKPDTFDGTVSLRQFLSQFDLVARANQWDIGMKAVVLASSLRGKARFWNLSKIWRD